MIKNRVYPLFFVFIRGVNVVKNIKKSVTPNVTPLYTFRFTLSLQSSPLMSLQSHFLP